MLTLLRIRTTPTEHEEGTTWLELFFDLVYVAILVVLGNRLSHSLALPGGPWPQPWGCWPRSS